ncbi:MAG TPA: sialidase family protein, partial [Actinomycetota bacterium]
MVPTRVRPLLPAAATLVAATILAAAVAFALTGLAAPTHPRGGEAELLEQRETTDRRLDALARAIERGRFGGSDDVVTAAAPGWRGAVPLDLAQDDWEPAIAADPSAPYVYWLATRYAPKPCPGNCPSPWIALSVSSDGGATWDAARPLCACKGSGQFDPIVEVVPDTGHVYALYMNGYNVVFTRSTDHGASWSTPVKTYGNVSWSDKPALTSSADGRHVYVTWNGPTNGDPWVAVSHDFGATWSQQKLVNSSRYFFAYDGTTLPGGTVVLSQSSFDYSGPGGSAVGQIHQHAFVSTDQGVTWTNVVVDQVELGIPCATAGCYPDFHSGHSNVSADPTGKLYLVYDGATTPGGPQGAWVRTSTDGGITWSSRTQLSAAGAHTTGPTVEAAGAGDVRVWYASQDGGGRWSVFHRSSSNGGTTWS